MLSRRFLLKSLGLLGGLLAVKQASAHHTDSHFDDASIHQIVYQCNKADDEYLASVLFSAGELLRKYGDDVEIVVAAFGPGIHLLATEPGRPVSAEHQRRAASLAQYGVAFHACGNTLESLGLSDNDLHSYVKVVPIGVDDIMLLQQKGFAYVSL